MYPMLLDGGESPTHRTACGKGLQPLFFTQLSKEKHDTLVRERCIKAPFAGMQWHRSGDVPAFHMTIVSVTHIVVLYCVRA